MHFKREVVDSSSLAAIPAGFAAQPPGAREYQLAFVQIPNNPDYATRTNEAFEQILYGAQFLLINVEYQCGGVECVQAVMEGADGTHIDIAKTLIAEGHALAEQRNEKRFAALVSKY